MLLSTCVSAPVNATRIYRQLYNALFRFLTATLPTTRLCTNTSHSKPSAVTASRRRVCSQCVCACGKQGGDEGAWGWGGGEEGRWRVQGAGRGGCSVEKRSRKPRDFISHIAPRPVIFPTADRRRKLSLCRGKASVASRLEAPPSKPSRPPDAQPLHVVEHLCFVLLEPDSFFFFSFLFF